MICIVCDRTFEAEEIRDLGGGLLMCNGCYWKAEHANRAAALEPNVFDDEPGEYLPFEEAESAGSNKPTAWERLSRLTVKEDYIKMIGHEEWIFDNLMIKNQVIVIIGKSGSAKTTIFYYFVAPWIISNTEGMRVFYLDCDSPASDHQQMAVLAGELGPRFMWINPLTHGKSAEELLEILREFVVAGSRLDDCIFILDTMKKFIDLLDKRSVKPFFNLMRQLSSLGATIVLLGHANKHRDSAGHLVFEGVGDVQSDADAMIFFERISAPEGGNNITTVIDPDKGAKVRGLYKSISFHVAPDRTVTLNKDVVPVPDWKPAGAKQRKPSEEDIVEAIAEVLAGAEMNQRQLTANLKGVVEVGRDRLHEILNAVAVNKASAAPGQIYYLNNWSHNQKLYGVLPVS